MLFKIIQFFPGVGLCSGPKKVAQQNSPQIDPWYFYTGRGLACFFLSDWPQAALGGLPIDDWALKADKLKIFSTLPRILKVRLPP